LKECVTEFSAGKINNGVLSLINIRYMMFMVKDLSKCPDCKSQTETWKSTTIVSALLVTYGVQCMCIMLLYVSLRCH